MDRSEKAVWWRRKLARAEWLDVLQRTVPLHVAQLRDVINVVKPTPVSINVSLSTAMGCPMEGDIAKEEVLGWMRRLAELGVHGVTLCDTTGMAYPSQVGDLCRSARDAFSALELTLHFHNTRGMALANTLAALDAGIDRRCIAERSGGCPYAPGATGNVCTEELVHMLELDGYETTIDLNRALAASARLPGLMGHDVPSQLLKAGQRLELHPMPPTDTVPEQRAFTKEGA